MLLRYKALVSQVLRIFIRRVFAWQRRMVRKRVSSSPQMIGIIGEPYEVPGVGTLSYPFVVLQASSNQKTSVISVAP